VQEGKEESRDRPINSHLKRDKNEQVSFSLPSWADLITAGCMLTASTPSWADLLSAAG
jgi:hypothetical protein